MRVVVTALVLVTLLAGTVNGRDHHFPFGPFRMFAHKTKTHGRVTAAALGAVSVDGEPVSVTFKSLGLRRAEVEGQIGQHREDPNLLPNLAKAYERAHPRGPELAELELVNRIFYLRNGKVVGRDVKTLGVWRR